jgi:hypothetical protein
MAQRAEGVLPAAKAGELDFHLTRCQHCKKIEEADSQLKWALRLFNEEPPKLDPRLFDDRVIERMRAPVPSWQQRIVSFCRSLPGICLSPAGLPYQLVGGAACAALLTLWCVMPAGQAVTPGPSHMLHGQAAQTADQDGQPPVPFESLLHAPTPRAALLWTTPRVVHRPHAAPEKPQAGSNQRGDIRSQGQKQGMMNGQDNIG